MQYLRKCWYQFGWSGEVTRSRSLSRTLLNEPVVVWRDGEGALGALLDRCVHRFAPLSAGRVTGDGLACGYHGLAFGRTGTCTVNPHGPITAGMRVKSFPVEERHDAIWVWMGQGEDADPDLIPRLDFIDETPRMARVQETMWNEANYQLLSDNILDLSHVDYIHPETLGGMMTGAETRTMATDDEVVVEWSSASSPTPLGYKAMVPEGPCAVWMRVVWRAPALMRLDVAVTPAGVPHADVDIMHSVHSISPATDRSSHYFLCSARKFAVDDQGVTDHLRSALMRAFLSEDKPMIEKQQARIGDADLFSLKPVLLAIDAGAVHARRKLEKLIAAEQVQALLAAE